MANKSFNSKISLHNLINSAMNFLQVFECLQLKVDADKFA